MELLEHKAKLREKYPVKPDFRKRMEDLIGKKDSDEFFEIAYYGSPSSIRINTLKISVEECKQRLWMEIGPADRKTSRNSDY